MANYDWRGNYFSSHPSQIPVISHVIPCLIWFIRFLHDSLCVTVPSWKYSTWKSILQKQVEVSFVNEEQTPDHYYTVSTSSVIESFCRCLNTGERNNHWCPHFGRLLKLNWLQQDQSNKELYLVHFQKRARGFVSPKRVCSTLSWFY